MENIQISMVQERVATGIDQSAETIMTIGKDEYGNLCGSWDSIEKIDVIYTQVIFTHSWLLAGAWEDVLEDFVRAARRQSQTISDLIDQVEYWA